MLGTEGYSCGDDRVAVLFVLQQGREPHAVSDLEVSGLGERCHDLVRQLRELEEVVEVLLGDGQAIGHLRANPVVICVDSVPVIARTLQIGDVLALSIFQIGEPESGLVIERLDTRYELDFAMVVGIQPETEKCRRVPTINS